MRAYLTTAVLARFADEGVAVALALLALARTGSAALGAFTLTAWLAPHAVAAPLAGALAERARRPRLFYGCALALFAASLALLGLTVGVAPTPLALIFALVGGSCGPVVTGGLSSLLAGLAAGSTARTRAYALDAATYNAASLAAPAAVTALATTFTPAVATGALATAAGGAALLAPALPAPPRHGPAPAGQAAGQAAGQPAPERPELTGPTAGEPAPAEPAPGEPAPAPPAPRATPVQDVRDEGGESVAAPAVVPLRSRVAAGLRALWRIRPLRAVTVATSVAFVGVGALPVTAVLLAGQRGEADGGGLLMTAYALGALGGAVALARRPSALDPARLATLCLLLTGAALAGAASAPSFPVVVALFALAGLGDGPLLSATLRIRADHAPPDAHTQVFTLGAGFKQTAAAAGAALVGALSGVTPALLLLAVAGFHAVAALLLHVLGRPGPPARSLNGPTTSDR